MNANEQDIESLVQSSDPGHPANHICTLCAKFYTLGWVRLTTCAWERAWAQHAMACLIVD